ncbi:hypothetical protein OIU79_030759 [Salix purpurea]|uniref:Uncharacterized protein n=1 Tax=Salix purpurea TaxID=77065 RepID=A0A9Q0VBC8_SALPP|nr:hypothetical protein OIU79_030759 [Salix purpurea]
MIYYAAQIILNIEKPLFWVCSWRTSERKQLHYLNNSSADNFSLVEILECFASLLKTIFSRNSIGKIEYT